MILPFGITGSTHMWNSNNPSSRNYGINTRSRVPKSPYPFWTEVQGWYNPTTFTGTEISGYILNRGSGMMQSPTFMGGETSRYIFNWILGMIQSYHFHGGRDLRIHFEPRFRDDAIHHFHGGWDLWIHFQPKFMDDAILPHSRRPKSPDLFWTDVPWWYNPSSFSRTEFIESL